MSGESKERRSARLTIVLLAAALVVTAIACLGLGRYNIPFTRIVEILISPFAPPAVPVGPAEANVVFTVRMPRILLTLLTGAGLALAGGTMQGVFRNPLVGPQLMGVSSGAAFGGVLAILFSLPRYGLLAASFAFGLAALLLVFALNSIVARRNILALVLAGVIVSGFFAALVSLVQYLADTEDKLRPWSSGCWAASRRQTGTSFCWSQALRSQPVS